jgi:hypothetical protein
MVSIHNQYPWINVFISQSTHVIVLIQISYKYFRYQPIWLSINVNLLIYEQLPFFQPVDLIIDLRWLRLSFVLYQRDTRDDDCEMKEEEKKRLWSRKERSKRIGTWRSVNTRRIMKACVTVENTSFNLGHSF